jgi:glycosyltransferase involved in cell wall biosynthesis
VTDRVLVLAPQPFFEERGTPIAVRMLLEALAEPGRLEFDLITYSQGSNVTIPGVTHLRTAPLPAGIFIRPGLSLTKLVADVLLLFRVLGVLWSKPRGHYKFIHAVEEAAFIALLAKCFFGIPYIYDMDSSLADQVVEKVPALGVLSPVLRWSEAIAVRNARCVIGVCDSLVERAKNCGARWSELLTDVSLLGPADPALNLRAELGLPAEAKIALYVGNLERYQGLDLLLEAWGEIENGFSDWHLVLIGGATDNVRREYAEKVARLGAARVTFAGPRPVNNLSSYLACADLLVSPRIKGNNTPMKIYSYLHAGRAIVATRLTTHTQVLDDSVAVLGKVEEFSATLARAMSDHELRLQVARNAQARAIQRYTLEVFRVRVRTIYGKALAI